MSASLRQESPNASQPASFMAFSAATSNDDSETKSGYIRTHSQGGCNTDKACINEMRHFHPEVITHGMALNKSDLRQSSNEENNDLGMTLQKVETTYSNDDSIKCRYCFGGASGWIIKHPLISPCWCAGSLEFTHRSCLEKWLTVRKKSNCDLCNYKFVTKKKYKALREIKFEKMEFEDVFMLIATVLVYITFIMQFLAAAYIGLLVEHISRSVLAVCMTGLALGLMWFLIGCIVLTILTYTSDYWISWRKMNKQISIVMESTNKHTERRSQSEETAEASMNEPV